MNSVFSQAAESNKNAILEVLREMLIIPQAVLEIGSGTGQHAVFFAEKLPHITWQCADQSRYHDVINHRLSAAGLDNLPSPLVLEVETFDWKINNIGSVFSANTAHIMSWNAVEAMFCGVGQLLEQAKGNGFFMLYGPFNRNGRYTSPSNRQFDQILKSRDPQMGIRDDGDLSRLAHQNGLKLFSDIAMPANNRILVWNKYKLAEN